MTEPTTNQREPDSGESAAGASSPGAAFDAGDGEERGHDGSQGSANREWVTQLQAMIDSITTQAAPVMRDVAAKAAELAAIAGEKAGPFARRAADVTAEAGTKLAERGREVAADLRRDAAAAREDADGHGGDRDYMGAPDLPESTVVDASGPDPLDTQRDPAAPA